MKPSTRRSAADQIALAAAKQMDWQRFCIELIIVNGKGQFAAGARVRGYFTPGLNLWHVEGGGLFLPSDVTYAQNHPCGDAVDVSVTNAPSLG